MTEPTVQLYVPNECHFSVAYMFAEALSRLAKQCVTHSSSRSAFNFALIDKTLAAQDTEPRQGSLFLLSDAGEANGVITRINKELTDLFDQESAKTADKRRLSIRFGYDTKPQYLSPNCTRTPAETFFRQENEKMIRFLETLGRIVTDPLQRFELAKSIEEEYFSRRTVKQH